MTGRVLNTKRETFIPTVTMVLTSSELPHIADKAKRGLILIDETSDNIVHNCCNRGLYDNQGTFIPTEVHS